MSSNSSQQYSVMPSENYIVEDEVYEDESINISASDYHTNENDELYLNVNSPHLNSSQQSQMQIQPIHNQKLYTEEEVKLVINNYIMHQTYVTYQN